MEKTIIACSKKLFYENGYFKTKISDITELSKTSTGNFYRYFKSKEDVLIAVIRQELSLYRDEIESISNSQQDFNWKMDRFTNTFMNFFKENPDFFILLNRLEENNEKASKKLRRHTDMIWTDSKKIFIDSLKKVSSPREGDIYLAESFFESQLKIFINSILKKDGEDICAPLLIPDEIKRFSARLLCIITGICDSLDITIYGEKYDPVTNAYSRYFLEQKVKDLSHRKVPFSATKITFDFTGNESVSDFFRDSILRYFVSLITDLFRHGDMIGRISHEEFMFLAPKSTIDVFSVRYDEITRSLQNKFPAYDPASMTFVSVHITDTREYGDFAGNSQGALSFS